MMRADFEQFISEHPFKRSTRRVPLSCKWATGQYRDVAVQLAWQAWQEAQSQMVQEAQSQK